MASNQPEPGDLIEISRDFYQHWAIYVGDGYVVHLAPPSESGANTGVKSVFCEKALVKKELLKDVVGTDRWTVKNLLDNNYNPRPVNDILKEARSLVGRELSYNVKSHNCEHFVTNLRYGRAESRQVRNFVAGAAVFAGAALLAGAAYMSAVEEKEKKRKGGKKK